MNNCSKCIWEGRCQHKAKSEDCNFTDRDLYEILQELSPEQTMELMRFADSLRGKSK